jgi:hypothetical protein
MPHITQHNGQKRADHPKSKNVKICQKEVKNKTDEKSKIERIEKNISCKR